MDNTVRILVFLAATATLAYISRASLRNPRSHGFYRFFAWEFILALLILNIVFWFVEPFTWHQLISWFLLILSIILLVFGFRSLVKQGRPVQQREGDPQLLSFEKTSTLVTTGIFHYIRHPLYSSLLFLTWGIYIKSPGWLGILLTVMATVFLWITAKVDEAECIRYFGEVYRTYIHRTRMFIPFVI
jgi:protein-S-isoprenylcysteine O-methyltransferase Ste14